MLYFLYCIILYALSVAVTGLPLRGAIARRRQNKRTHAGTQVPLFIQ